MQNSETVASIMASERPPTAGTAGESKGFFGFNAAAEEFKNLMKAGIIDPTKVVRSALQNAASVAGLLLTTECIVAEKPDERGSAAPGMPPGAMM